MYRISGGGKKIYLDGDAEKAHAEGGVSNQELRRVASRAYPHSACTRLDTAEEYWNTVNYDRIQAVRRRTEAEAVLAKINNRIAFTVPTNPNLNRFPFWKRLSELRARWSATANGDYRMIVEEAKRLRSEFLSAEALFLTGRQSKAA